MIIYGKNPVKEAIFANRKIYHLYLDKNHNDSKLISFLKDKNVDFEYKGKDYLNEITDNALHQGIVADVMDYQYFDLDELLKSKKELRLLILDELSDPHNLGAILRTAEAVNLDGIILSNKQQVKLNATVAKVSSGAIEHVKVFLVGNINQTIDKLKQNNVFVIGTDGNTEKEFTDIENFGRSAIVLGSEGQGIRPLVKQNCDMLVKIPMKGKINSLNVSVAAALMMYMQYFKK
ncbi:23S rRNA (guanosine(2251)-2'-O)-methyltransferase RlmB [Acholeplasma sp. OttesenSCG-928-E16]|nr:23S rRNA (guanosine(2251)-2'-O)-methyltransferase RlmB [Acholeplasma sp. OttesenSCG-928-E16]